MTLENGWGKTNVIGGRGNNLKYSFNLLLSKGIYVISCACGAIHIGETGCSVETYVSGGKRCFRTALFSKHQHETVHENIFDNICILSIFPGRFVSFTGLLNAPIISTGTLVILYQSYGIQLSNSSHSLPTLVLLFPSQFTVRLRSGQLTLILIVSFVGRISHLTRFNS